MVLVTERQLEKHPLFLYIYTINSPKHDHHCWNMIVPTLMCDLRIKEKQPCSHHYHHPSFFSRYYQPNQYHQSSSPLSSSWNSYEFPCPSINMCDWWTLEKAGVVQPPVWPLQGKAYIGQKPSVFFVNHSQMIKMMIWWWECLDTNIIVIVIKSSFIIIS